MRALGAGLALLAPVGAAAEAVSGEAGSWDVDAYYAGDLWRNLGGGIERGGAYLDSLDVIVSWDGERAAGVKGLSAQAFVLWNNGRSISDKVGDSFLLSNIETVQSLRLYEAWLQYAPTHPERSLKFGMYDLNSEFDATDTGAVFLNSTFGTGVDLAQSGVAGPSIFPLTSFGVRGRWRFDGRWRVQAALLDGVPGDPERPRRTAVKLAAGDGALGVLEVEHDGDGRRWVFGHWRYSARFDELAAVLPDGSPVRSRGNSGSYAFVETPITGALAAGREASATLRIGRADPRFNAFRDAVSLAFAWQGGLLGREGEVAGLAFAHARSHDASRTGGESVIELTWKVPVLPRLTLQPDLQYILNPGSVPGRRDALVAGLRFDLRLDGD